MAEVEPVLTLNGTLLVSLVDEGVTFDVGSGVCKAKEISSLDDIASLIPWVIAALMEAEIGSL